MGDDYAPRRNRLTSKLLWSTVIAICALGCGDPLGSEESELQRMRAVWREAGITDYSYRFQRLCFCLSVDPVIIEVQSGVIISVVDAETGEAVSPQVADFYLTVDGIFEAIQDAIDRSAHSLTAEYHPSLGYPTAVDIDYEEFAVDEEMSFRASELQAK